MQVELSPGELLLLDTALRSLEAEMSQSDPDAQELKEVRKLFQRLHTLRTAQ